MKTILWDFNGTIIDDVQLCVDIENKMAKERGMIKVLSVEEYKDLFCFPVIDYYYKVGYTFQNETYDDISVEWGALYDAEEDRYVLTEGFTEVIRRSIEKGWKNVILSASEQTKLIRQCRMLGIYDFFDEILGTDNLYGGSKVKIAEKWMERTGTDPRDCMFIGDTLHDEETARAIGIRDITLVTTGHQSERQLRKGNARIIRSLKEVDL